MSAGKSASISYRVQFVPDHHTCRTLSAPKRSKQVQVRLRLRFSSSCWGPEPLCCWVTRVGALEFSPILLWPVGSLSCCTARVGESNGEGDGARVRWGSDLKTVSWESRTVRGAGSLNPDSSSLSSVRLGSGTPCRQRRSDIGCVSGEAWISAMSACAL